MKIFDVKGFMEQMNPGKTVTLDLDDACACAFDITAKEGIPNLLGHITFNRVKVTIDQVVMYVSIENHRVATGIAQLKEKFAGFADVILPTDVLMNMDSQDKLASMTTAEKLLLVGDEKAQADAAPANYAQLKADIQHLSGLTEQELLDKLAAYRA